VDKAQLYLKQFSVNAMTTLVRNPCFATAQFDFVDLKQSEYVFFAHQNT
jgi:hypothetical protein